MPTDKGQVLYICSDVRAGSTLLDMLLARHPELVSVGEGHHLHDYLSDSYYNFNIKEQECTCGKKISECEFWQKIATEYEKRYKIDLSSEISKYPRMKGSIQQLIIHFINIVAPSVILKRLSKINSYYKASKELTAFRFRLYEVINDTMGTKYVVDSSKWPEALRFYSLWGKNQSKFLIINRDPRAVAYSKYTRRPERGDIKYALFDSIRIKYLINFYKKHLTSANVMEIQYEDFVKDPSYWLNRVNLFFGLDLVDLMKIKPKEAHNLGGSPHRFESEIKIKADERWRNDQTVLKIMKESFIYKLFYKE